jgi:hypothetical protein
MTQLVTSRERAIVRWLEDSTEIVVPAGNRRWQCVLGNGSLLPVSVATDADFLLFDAPSPTAYELAQTPQLLCWNAELEGGAKFALVPGPWRLRLRAEMAIEIDEDADASLRVAENLRGIQAACLRLEGVNAPADDAEPTAPTAFAADSARSAQGLFSLLRETSWPFQERASGIAVVELPLRGSFCQALLEENGRGVRAAIELLSTDAIAPVSQLAVAALLLCAGGALKLVRPYASDAGEHFACGFEVRFAGGPCSSELEHALAALSVACRSCRDEVNSLLDKWVAESYLAIRNLPPTLAGEEFYPWVNQKPQPVWRCR